MVVYGEIGRGLALKNAKTYGEDSSRPLDKSIQGVIGTSRMQLLVAYRGERGCPSAGAKQSGSEAS